MSTRAKILVVDDDLDIQELLVGMISESYDVSTANDGNEANAMIKACQYDIVISDYKMPGINGANLAKKHPNTNFIFITGMVHKPSSLAAFQILSKPVSEEDLLNCITKLLSEKKQVV